MPVVGFSIVIIFRILYHTSERYFNSCRRRLLIDPTLISALLALGLYISHITISKTRRQLLDLMPLQICGSQAPVVPLLLMLNADLSIWSFWPDLWLLNTNILIFAAECLLIVSVNEIISKELEVLNDIQSHANSSCSLSSGVQTRSKLITCKIRASFAHCMLTYPPGFQARSWFMICIENIQYLGVTIDNAE